MVEQNDGIGPGRWNKRMSNRLDRRTIRKHIHKFLYLGEDVPSYRRQYSGYVL